MKASNLFQEDFAALFARAVGRWVCLKYPSLALGALVGCKPDNRCVISERDRTVTKLWGQTSRRLGLGCPVYSAPMQETVLGATLWWLRSLEMIQCPSPSVDPVRTGANFHPTPHPAPAPDGSSGQRRPRGLSRLRPGSRSVSFLRVGYGEWGWGGGAPQAATATSLRKVRGASAARLWRL
jgi:hypothetical protein